MFLISLKMKSYKSEFGVSIMASLYTNILIYFSLYTTTIAAYTLRPSQSLIDGHNLTSQGGTFQLGFFRPSTTSNHRYLGIWYKAIPVQTVVWVANRDSPLNDTSGALKVSSSGILVIVHSHTQEIIWSSNSNTSQTVQNPILEFLDSGNIVLRDMGNGDPNSYLWQSFDYPSDTLLPGMKEGWDLKTGRNRHLQSWKKFDDPSPGDYTWGMELDGYPKFIMRKGLDKYYCDGSWNGLQGSGSPELKPNVKFTYQYKSNDVEKYFMYQLVDRLSFMRIVLTQTGSEGHLQLLAWVKKTNSWVVQVTMPRDHCDKYAQCGAYGICDVTDIDVCQCLEGFKPKSSKDWSRFDWSLGCQRRVPVKCSKDDGFKRFTEVKLPETTADSWINKTMTLAECRVKCLSICSCMAYANLDITDSRRGCILWFTDLVDMRKLPGARQTLYIRMDSSELGHSETIERVMLIALIALAIGVIILALGSFCIWKKRRPKGGSKKDDLELLLHHKSDDTGLSLFDLATVTRATNNFSEENKLGEGGFGPVYKGMLDGEEVAVKRLSKSSIQGVNEFKNEVILISKLQHRNLVRILGCCIEGGEKILIYEYMQNNNLDSFIFDETKGRALDWGKRFEIILGIARGLLYLHHDARVRIIHRDLKASNVLLDRDMVAKISDFGMARIFLGDQTEARTKRVVGTRGYMSPEYAIDGHFSVKSDVFSFGVLILEIISGKRNRGFSHPDHGFTLLGHAWRLWSEDKSMELAEKSMDGSHFVEDISRCIHIGLLCVQKGTDQRPTMSSVVLMLSSDAALPEPQHPGFYIERSAITKENSYDREQNNSNNASITMLEAR